MPNPLRHPRALLLGLLLATLVAACTPTSARAQTDTSALTREALAEFEAGHWEEARVLLKQLYAVRPSGESLRLLGAASYELRDYAAAVTYLRRSLAEPQRPLTPARRADAERALTAALRFVGSVRVLVPGVAAAQVRVDEQDVQPEADGTLTLSVGRHDVEVSAPGYLTQTVEVRIDAGAAQELTVALREDPPPDPFHGQAPSAEQDPGRATVDPDPEPEPEPEPDTAEAPPIVVGPVPPRPQVVPEQVSVSSSRPASDTDERRSNMRFQLITGATLVVIGGAALPWWLSRLDVLNNTCPCLDQERISRRRWGAMSMSLGGLVLGGVFMYSGIKLALSLRRDRSVAMNLRFTGDALFLQGSF